MKKLWVLLALAALAPARADDVAKIVDCMRANQPPALQVNSIELVTTTSAGETRTLRGSVYTLRGSTSGLAPMRAMLRITEPSYVAGSAYLMRETSDYTHSGMYMYLPSVGRVRRITGEFADGALLGSSFSYEDFKELYNSFTNLQGAIEKTADVDGRSTNVLLFKPTPGKVPPVYTSVRVWVDQQACVALKADFYQGEKLRKQLSVPAGALQQSAGYWLLKEIDMQDLKDGKKSALRMLDMRSNTELPSRLFDPKLFFLGK